MVGKHPCKGTCEKLKPIKGRDFKPYNTGGPYRQGFKRCSSCCIFMKWVSNYCPCCGSRLSVRPNSTKYKYIEHLYVY